MALVGISTDQGLFYCIKIGHALATAPRILRLWHNVIF